MAELMADEDFPFQVVRALRELGHDVLTMGNVGLANRRIPDPEVLAFATGIGRGVLTMNRDHFRRLHRSGIDHAGIILATRSVPDATAPRIHEALEAFPTLAGRCIFVRVDQIEEIPRRSREIID